MVEFLDLLRGVLALVIAGAVLATLAQVALGTPLATVVGDFHLPIVVLFVALMALVLAREVWDVLAARR